MAQLPEGFDADKQGPMRSFDVLPKDDYLAMATESEIKDTKDTRNNNKILQFTWKIIDGEHKGRILWSSLNIVNDNKTAADIAYRELGAIGKACGVKTPKESSELHGIPIVLSVGVEKRNDTGEMTNRIQGYRAPAGAVPASVVAAAPVAAAPAAAKPPWA